ncbi:MAG: tetratricopeptide repeat protein [Planctomycetota bacterium]
MWNPRNGLCRGRPWLAGLLCAALLGPDVRGGQGPSSSPREQVSTQPSAGAAVDPFSDASVQFDFASGLFLRGLYTDAAKEYDDFLQQFPADPRAADALLHLGESLFESGEFVRAEEAFQRMLRLFPNNPNALGAQLRIGCARFERKQYEEAIAAFQRLTSAPAPAGILSSTYYYLGRSFQEILRLPEAHEALARALEGGEGIRPLALYSLGEVEYALERYADAEGRFRRFFQDFPGHRLGTATVLRLAETLRAQGKLDEAARFYSTLAQYHPETYEGQQAYLGLGWVQIAQEDFAAAEATARKALAVKTSPLASSLHYLLGVALLREKKYEAAEAEFSLIVAGPDVTRADRDRIWALLGAGRTEEAVRQANLYLSKYPNQEPGTAWHLLGIISFRQADYTAALDCFRKACNDPATPYREEAAYQLTLAFERLGRDAEAATSYRFFATTFPKSPLLPAALLGLGNAEMRQKNFPAAVDAYTRLPAIPEATAAQREEAWSQQAVAHYELQDYDKMDACYRAIASEFPRSAAAPEALYWIAWGEQHRQKYAEAIEAYTRFLQTYPAHALADRVRYRLGMTCYQAGRIDEAAARFYEILTRYPQIEIGQNELLWLGSHYMQRDKLAEAVTIYEALLQRHPGSTVRTMTLYYLAEIQRKQKNWPAAMDTYRQLANEKEPRYKALAYFGLGICLRETGQFDEARATLDKADLSADDPLRAALDLQFGLLDEAQGKTDSAMRAFLRVGLLYDDLDLCGQALLEAGALAEAKGDLAKAVACYEELTGAKPNSYGAKYASRSPWSQKAALRLAELRAPRPPESTP